MGQRCVCWMVGLALSVGAGAAPAEPAVAPATTPPQAAPSAPAAAFACVGVRFDLRGMPHFDGTVSEVSARHRRDALAHQLVVASGEPRPDILLGGAPTMFTARFAASKTQTALARCAAGIGAVVPPPAAHVKGRALFRDPKATPCTPCSGEVGGDPPR